MVLDRKLLDDVDAMHRTAMSYRSAACSLLRRADQIEGDAHRNIAKAAGLPATSRLVVNYETGEVVEAKP